jgi:hypothetical protein
MAAKSQSRNVNGYVTAELRRRQLVAKLDAKERALDPLRVKLRDADTAARIRFRKLTGGQLAEARRLLEATAGSDLAIAEAAS